MNSTSISIFLGFSGNKIRSQNFLHQGPFDPGPLTEGARGHVGWPRWSGRLGRSQPDLLPDTGDGRPGRVLRREGKEGKGSKRTTSSPCTRRRGQLGRRKAGSGEFGGGGSQVRQGNGDGGGDSRCSSSIPWARRTREARWCWGLARRRPGRCVAAALAGGHGGAARLLGGGRGREERQGEKEMREKRGRAASRCCSRGRLGLRRQAGGGTPAALRRTRSCFQLEEE
jgi:hypothetical protein